MRDSSRFMKKPDAANRGPLRFHLGLKTTNKNLRVDLFELLREIYSSETLWRKSRGFLPQCAGRFPASPDTIVDHIMAS